MKLAGSGLRRTRWQSALRLGERRCVGSQHGHALQYCGILLRGQERVHLEGERNGGVGVQCHQDIRSSCLESELVRHWQCFGGFFG